MLKLAIGSALLVTATQVVAVSLGATQGSVIIGRPLDLLVQSSITASEAASGLCLEAEVLYGDTRVPATAITTGIHQTGGEGAGALRIRSTDPVNEPIVTLILRAGCTTSFRRSYTLLADEEPRVPAALQPTTVQQTVVPRPAGPAVPIPAPQSASATSVPSTVAPSQASASDDLLPETPIRLSEPAPRPAGVTRILSKSRPQPTVYPAEAAPQVAPQVTGSVEQPSSAAQTRTRLQLDPVDMSSRSGVPSETETPGETSQSGPVTPSESGQAEPVASESDRQLALQQEVEALRAEQERMRLAIETLNNQLRDAQSSQSSIPWLYGASVLAFLLLVGYWFALRSRRRNEIPTADKNDRPWWESVLPAIPTQAAETRAGSSESPPAAESRSAAPASVVVGNPSGGRADWSSESIEEMEEAAGRESMLREVAVAPLALERLQDLWQQVEFCESIGQYRDAMSALQAFVTDGPRASEAPYLMWLKIAYRFGTEADHSLASSFYESHFQRPAPVLAAIESPLGLDDDASCVQSLGREWPNHVAREVLVASLCSQPGDLKGTLTVRTLQAFDDLIMLIGMLDILPTVGVAPSEPVAAQKNAMLEDLEWAFPTWESVADMPVFAKSETGPMQDVELPALSSPPEAKPVQSVKPAPQGLDFDLFLLEPHNENPAGEDPAGGERKVRVQP